MDAYRDADVWVVAFTSDEEEGARKMVEEEDLDLPVAYGLDVEEMKDRLGLYIQKGEKVHLQPAQFILEPDGTVALACYSTGAVGRLDAEEALEKVKFERGDED